MTVAGSTEASSTSREELALAAPHAPTLQPGRETVECVHIGDIFAGIPAAAPGGYRAACAARFDTLFPPTAAAPVLPAEERFPMGDGPLTGLYQRLALDRETARRVSMFEADRARHWYVFRLNYGHGLDRIGELGLPDCTLYLPSIRSRVGRRGEVRDVFLRNFFFAFTTRRVAEALHGSPRAPHARIYYDHFLTDGRTGRDAPLTIPRRQMLDFMLIAEARSLDKRVIDPRKAAIPLGSYVEVTDGPFRGVRGWLTRVGGKQRVVARTGLCLLATGYISSYGYRVVEEE